MRLVSPLVPVSLLLLLIAAPRTFGAGFRLFRSTWGNVIANTDMTPEGRELTPPSPENPVYYGGSSLGCKLGSIPGEHLPDVHKLNEFVAAVLAKQGYMGATPGEHEPTLFLVLQWGYLQPGSDDLMWFLGYDARQDIAAPTAIGMLGMEVFRRGFRSAEIETILDYADEAIYGIIVTAFEFKSASTPKPVIYWRTRIGLPANGKSMADALPTMVVAGGPTFGRETKKPFLRSSDNVREGRVELGELQVIGFDDEPEPPAKKPAGKK